MNERQPITWTGLALAGVMGSGAVYYYYNEKERLQTQSTSSVLLVPLRLLTEAYAVAVCS